MSQGKLMTLAALGLCLAARTDAQSKLKKVLIYTNCGGFVHTDGIRGGNNLIKLLGTENGFTVEETGDALKLNAANLKQYNVVVFNNNTGLSVPGAAEQAAFKSYMEQGGGWFGIHGALDHSGASWQWYYDFAGTQFASHSPVQKATVKVDPEVKANPELSDILKAMPPAGTTEWTDEWYSYRTNPRVKVDMIMTLDEANSPSFTPNPAMGDHPMTWCYKLPKVGEAQGRFFFTAMGHYEKAFEQPFVKPMFLAALRWAAGDTPGITGIRKDQRAAPAAEGLRAGKGSLRIAVKDQGPHTVEIIGIDGRGAASASGKLPAEHVFGALDRNQVYAVRVTSRAGVHSFRAFVP